jgi:cytochrome P450
MSTADPATRVPPGPQEHFDVGETDDSLLRMEELFARYGDIYRVYAPARRSYVYVINHPDDVKRVLVSNHRNFRKGLGLDRVKILLGNGIMTSEGELWRRQRYMMQPSFHRRVVSGFAALASAANDRLIDRWERAAAAGESINVTDDVSELTLEIVLGSIFGRDLQRLAGLAAGTVAGGTGGTGNPFEILTREPARDLKFAYRFRQLAKLVGELIRRRRAAPEEHFDFLAMMMDARDKETGDAMSERELIDEVMTLIVAGHETTASGLNWTWYLLSQHPAADAQLHAEIAAAPELAAPGLAEMDTLSYLQNVVAEALRLYPPGWLLSRRTIGPDVLGGYELPAGADVLLSPYLLHRHPGFWTEPLAFRPERFDAAHEAERPRFAYMPFAAGPRQCIGETLALYEMYLHLYKVVRRYRLAFTPDGPLELEAQINLRTRHPLHMRLERR